MDALEFYYVDPQYIAYLQTIDPRVPNVVYPGQHEKMLCGVVFRMNDVSYYVPLSHNTRSSKANFTILDRTGASIASLRIQYMIPVPRSVLTKVDIPLLMRKSPKYGNLVLKEYNFCNRPESVGLIMRKAERAYRISCDPAHSQHRFFCDFAALEAAMREYQTI